MKQCFTCKEIKAPEEFGIHRGKSDGLNYNCKVCERARQKANRSALRKRTDIVMPDQAVCLKCGLVKPASEFYVQRDRSTGLNAECKVCRAGYSSHYRHKQIALDPVAFKLRIMAHQAGQRARRDGVPFELNAERLIERFRHVTHCPILGIPFDWYVKGPHPKPNSPSLDKMIPELGYIDCNVWIISHRANYAKNDLNLHELLRFGQWATEFATELLP